MPHRRHVAIVDDEASVCESLALLLSTAQIESRTFASAEDYLASVPLDESSCVILDNQLPGLSGIGLLKRIAAAEDCDTAVILISGHGDVPTAVTAMKCGAFHFVEKPLDPEALLLTVEEALGRTEQVRDRQTQVQEFRARRALLTQREHEVFALLVQGLPTKLIARQLGITPRTTEHHRAAVMHKMQARTISHLVRMALSFDPPAGET
ncbi:MAG: response regulator [Roseiarcus sp.]|uniref:response regulator transcription factor n=1 Tax=Roseiarcus sp. TaxID=1969460 RepID=UPI003C3A64E0